MSEKENRESVERLWRLFEAREWEKAGQELHDDFEAVWPHTGEVFRGRANFIAVNENFPPIGDWHIHIKRIVAEGDLVVVLEAMKMEQPLNAHKAGVVTGLSASVGDVIAAGSVICSLK